MEVFQFNMTADSCGTHGRLVLRVPNDWTCDEMVEKGSALIRERLKDVLDKNVPLRCNFFPACEATTHEKVCVFDWEPAVGSRL